MAVGISNWQAMSVAEQKTTLKRPFFRNNNQIVQRVEEIISEVRTKGDIALRHLTLEFDQVDLVDFQTSQKEIDEAKKQLTNDQLLAIEMAIDNIRKFHEAQIPETLVVETMPGVRCERTSHPIDAVGLYVPAGTAPLPSTAIMLGIPATIAGCRTKIMCTPPRPDGLADPAVLVAASMSGISDIFKIGGAQAIGAMAYGTETIPKVNKVFGPGNAWVTEAKAQVAGDIEGAAIDMPAGPSEVLVIADAKANPQFVAADLLSQAEHGADSQVVLVTTSDNLAQNVIRETRRQLKALRRREIAGKSINKSIILVTDCLESATEISNRYAPEHLILHVDSPRCLLPAIRNAGSIFIGPWSPESVGDYCSGTNHVLPTYGHARNYSGLSVDQFMRHMTVQELTPTGLQAISGAVISMAGLEGLDAHAAAVECRLAFLECEK